jgi:putative ABC transport system permease protein
VFLESEGKFGSHRAVILSYALWRDKFGMRDDVLGETVVMNGEPYTVIGVMPQTFDFPRPETRLWVPAALDGSIFQQHPDAHLLRVIGRLKPDVTARASASRARAARNARERARGRHRPSLLRGKSGRNDDL